MELRQLQYFLATVQEKNITQAARKLHLSQPALSKQLQQLEEELNVTLFTRGSRQIRLTEEGLYFYNRSKDILQMVGNTKANIQQSHALKGSLRIGSGETKNFSFLALVLQSMRQISPDIHFNLVSGNGDEIKEKLDTGLIDFGLVLDPFEKQDLAFIPLPTFDHWGILVHQEHPLAKLNRIQPTDLYSVPLIISDQTLVDNQLVDWLNRPLHELSITGTYTLLYNATFLLSDATSAILCIEGIVNLNERNLCFVPLAPPLTAKNSLIWKKESVLSPVAAAFIKAVQKRIQKRRDE